MTSQRPPASRATWALAGLFLTSGVLHVARPRPFEAIVPRRLPRKRELVYLSGAAEIACAGGLAVPATRRLAGLLSAGLLVSIFPANVQMAVDILDRGSGLGKVLALARLPLQAPMVLTAWRAWRPQQ
jgi:uncharacterized membrane protein